MILTAPVNKIIPFSCVDGIGNRTAVFFQGCNQNCLYCHNPETIHLCTNCGACVEACPAGALSWKDGSVEYDHERCCSCDTCLRICSHDASPKIRRMTAKQLMEEIRSFFPFIEGITTSGGECSLYPEFLTEFYGLVKKAGKTTFLDTNGQLPLWEQEELMKVTDQTMIDLKAGTDEDHRMLTKKGIHIPIENIKRMADMDKLYEIRTVVVPGVVDNEAAVELGSKLIAAYPRVRYKLIKFRHYGVRENFIHTKEPSDEMMEGLAEIARKNGVRNILIT